jgi:large subunit ribosomal protein L25
LKKRILQNLINSESFLSAVIELDVMEKNLKLFQEMLLLMLISEEPIHIDFMRVVAGKKISTRNTCKIYKSKRLSPGLKSWRSS